jgi:hypothetical protein
MALGDITVLEEQADGSFKERIIDSSNINARSTYVSATPPYPVVDGTVWIDSATFRSHVYTGGVWAEISTD